MAKLIMTIDSDSEVESKVKKGSKKQKNPISTADEDDGMLLSSDVFLTTQNAEGKRQRMGKADQTGSTQLWKFSEVLAA